MFAKSLKCVLCGREGELRPASHCDACGGTLDVTYDYAKAFAEAPFRSDRREPGIWRYRPLLPVRSGVPPVTLGEGNTPLLPAERLAEAVGHDALLIKNETVNPTLSFKDRPISVAVTAARQFGTAAVVTASTGNTGVSAAAYAAKAGMPCRIYVPKGTPAEKVSLMRRYGAELTEVAGTFSDAYVVAAREADEKGLFNLTSTFLNPYGVEGDKTLAYEICRQHGGAPDWVVIPVGAGPLLVGCYKGFSELQAAGEIRSLPRMVAVQASGCAPIVRAFEQGASEVRPWGKPATIASGIADPLASYPADGSRTLHTVRQSGGLAVAVGDDEISEFVKLLAEREGILAEAAAATSVAAVRSMARASRVRPSETVVCVVTGRGLNDLSPVPGPARAKLA